MWSKVRFTAVPCHYRSRALSIPFSPRFWQTAYFLGFICLETSLSQIYQCSKYIFLSSVGEGWNIPYFWQWAESSRGCSATFIRMRKPWWFCVISSTAVGYWRRTCRWHERKNIPTPGINLYSPALQLAHWMGQLSTEGRIKLPRDINMKTTKQNKKE